MRGNFDTGRMKVRVIPAAIRTLIVDDETAATFPRVEHVGATIWFVQSEGNVEETHRVAGGIEICPPRVNPMTVTFLGAEEVIDRSIHCRGNAFIPEQPGAANKHQTAEG